MNSAIELLTRARDNLLLVAMLNERPELKVPLENALTCIELAMQIEAGTDAEKEP